MKTRAKHIFITIISICFIYVFIKSIRYNRSSDLESHRIEAIWRHQDGVKIEFLENMVLYSGKIIASYEKKEKNLWVITKGRHHWAPFDDKRTQGYAIIEKDILKLYLQNNSRCPLFWTISESKNMKKIWEN